MEKCTLIGSPNWYLSQILDCSWNHKVAFGSLSSLVVFDSLNTLNPRSIHQAHGGKILSVSFPPEGCGNRLLSTSDAGEAFVWNLDTFKVALVYKSFQKYAVYGSWSPIDGNLVVCADENGNIVQWNVGTNVLNGKSFKEHSFVVVSCCPHDRDLVATGTRQGLVCVVNIKVPGKETIIHKMRGHDSEVVSLSWCPVRENIFKPQSKQDCFILASGAKEKKIFFWRAGGDGLYEAFVETPLAPRILPAMKQQWNCVCWYTPTQFLVSTVGGEVLSLNVSKFGPKKGASKANWVNFSSNHNRCHVVVKSSPWTSKRGESEIDWRLHESSPRWVWTFGADRVVTGTCSEKSTAAQKLNTFGGAVHAMTISPIDGTSLAVGAADKTIRVVNLSEPQLKTMQTFSQKVSGKVMSLSWHPSKDGWLAYGTSDGRIGIQFTCAVKQPLLFRPFTKDSIYAMEWGPTLATIKASFESSEIQEENESELKLKPSNHVLYAVGGGVIAVMDPTKPDTVYEQPFKDILKVALKPQSLKAKNKPTGLSDLAWKPDFSLLALGDETGSIHLLSRSKEEELHLVASCRVHSTLIQDISWHPQCCASDTTDISPQSNWLATASNDVNICILDVTSVLEAIQGSCGDVAFPVSNVPCIATLKGHKSRVSKLAWSPHEGGRLMSVSYDYCAQVWNVINRQPVASYHGHSAPLLSCEWSPFNPSLAITSGQEGVLRIWNILEQEAKVPIAKNKDIVNLLIESKEANSHIRGNLTEESHSTKIQNKKKEKTLLPLSGPEIQNDDNNITILRYLLNANENVKLPGDEFGDDYVSMPLHYAFFANQSVVERYLMIEAKSGITTENSFTLNVWKGSIKDAINEAIQTKTLNSFIVSIAPTVSHKTWVEACEAYAQQLREVNEYSKASSYLLAIHKVEEAVQLLAENGKFRHAVAVARCRLPEESPLIKSLLLEWAQSCVTQGQQSLAAVCFASAGEWMKAAQCIARKKNPDRLLMAARIMKQKCPEDLTGSFYARECFDISLSQKNWPSAHAAVNLYPKLNHLALHIFVHEMIYGFKDSLGPADWLKLSDEGKESKSQTDTESDAVNVSISLSDEKVSALQSDLVTEVSVTSEDSAWLAVSSKVTLAFLAAPSLFPRINCKFVIDKDPNDQNTLQDAYRHLIQAMSSLYHYHITNMLNEKCVPIFLKFCIWLAPQGPFHAGSIFAFASTPLQSSLRAHLAAGLLLWVSQPDVTDACVSSLAIEAVDNLKGDIFSVESLKSFKVDFKLKLLQEKKVTRLLKEKQLSKENTESEREENEMVDPADKLKSLSINGDEGKAQDEKDPVDEEIEDLNKWVAEFTLMREKVPNPYLSYSNLLQYLNVSKQEEQIAKFSSCWQEANDTLNV